MMIMKTGRMAVMDAIKGTQGVNVMWIVKRACKSLIKRLLGNVE